MEIKRGSIKSIQDLLPIIIEHFPGHIYFKDLHRNYVCCNQAYADYLNLPDTHHIQGKSDINFYSIDKCNKMKIIEENILKNKKPITIDEDDFLSIKIPISHDGENMIGIVSISINYKNIKQQIQQPIKLLRDIISYLPGHIFWKDRHGVILGCNEQQAIDFGFKSSAEVAGKTDYELLGNSIDKQTKMAIFADVTRIDNEIMEEDTPRTIEESVVLPNGSEVTYLSHKKTLYDDNGDVIGLLGISMDITERKQLEEQLQKASRLAEAANQLKTEFIQNMQHDIRTPISGIWSFLNDMAHSDNLEKFRQTIPFAEKAADQLLGLCNEVIDFENIEYGDKPVYSHKFSLIDLAHAVINLNSIAAMIHDTTLVLDIDADVPDIIRGDDYRLKKILINLVGNAVKFTEHGQVTLKVQCLLSIERKVSLRFSVIDTGIGIPPEQIDKAFEKFTRLNPSNTGKFKGSGLGLHIVKKFATEIEAELDVASSVGKGSTFSLDVIFDIPIANLLADESEPHQEAARQLTMHLPSKLTEKHVRKHTIQQPTTATSSVPLQQPIAVPSPVQQPKSATQTSASPIRICFIEDDNLASSGGQGAIIKTARPCEIHAASNVNEALTLLAKQTFDLIISDIGLPDGSGFDIAIAVKQNPAHLNYQTPIVALTAHSDDAKRARAKEVGFLAVYNKPLKSDMAEKILNDFLPAHSQNHSATEIVDLALTMKMTGNDASTTYNMLRTLVNTFAIEKPSYFLAFARNDFTQARALFHKLSGGLAYIRVPTLEHIAAALHEDIKTCEQQQGNLADLQAKLDDLCAAVDAIAAWLDKHSTI